MLHILTLLVIPLQAAPVSPPAPVEVEVRTVDGGIYRVTLLQDALEVATRYGVLRVPAAELRSIQLGLHAAPGVAERVADAAKRLASSSHREREEATKELVTLGEHSQAAMRTATKGKDLEAAERAKAVLASLRESVAAERLALPAEDRIDAAILVTGRLTAKTLRVRSMDFGEAELPLHRIRSLRAIRATATEVTIDAAKHGSPGSPWLDSGVDVVGTATITASGMVDLWPASAGQYTTGPGGYKNAGVVGNTPYHAGTLLGRIGDNGKVFVVGERFEGTPGEGRLFLSVAPSPWNNLVDGAYRVKVEGR